MKGQALVTLLIFVTISIIVTSASIVIIMINSTGASKVETTRNVKTAAESGVENAILRLIRDPNYSDETFDIGDINITISVGGENPKTISSIARSTNFEREYQVEAQFIDGNLVISSWKEMF